MEDHPAGGCKRPIQQHRGGKAKDADRDIDAGTVTVQVAGVAETIPTPAPNATPSLRPTATKTINGTGSANTLPGTSANDLIDEKGGDAKIWAKNGSDVLIGGAGKDTFTFNTKPGNANVDVIVDFNATDDTIHLNDTAFTKLSFGKLSSSGFAVGDKALDSSDRTIDNDKTGAHSYDADGTGSTAAVKFAVIENLAKLTAAGVLVV